MTVVNVALDCRRSWIKCGNVVNAAGRCTDTYTQANSASYPQWDGTGGLTDHDTYTQANSASYPQWDGTGGLTGHVTYTQANSASYPQWDGIGGFTGHDIYT